MRGRARLVLGASLALVVLAASQAGATGDASSTAAAIDDRRPYDAPRLDSDAAPLPSAPPEYLAHDEGWLHVRYHPAAREQVRPLLGAAAQLRSDLAEALGVAPLASVEVRVAAIPAELARLGPADPPSNAGAVAYTDRALVLLSLASPLTLEPPRLTTRFRHALTHLALDEAVGRRPVPRWFHEGLAARIAGEDERSRFTTLTLAALRGRLLRLSELEASMPDDAPEASLAYAEAADFVRFLQQRSAPTLQRLVARLAMGQPFADALAGASASSVDALEHAWHEDMSRRYASLPVLFVGLALSLLALLVVLVRKLRKPRVSRAVALLRAKRLARHDRAPSEPTEESARRTTLRVLISRSRGAAAVAPRRTDGDVPKIEHDGRWHTLH